MAVIHAKPMIRKTNNSFYSYVSFLLYVSFLACILLQVETHLTGSGLAASAGYDKTLILLLLLGATVLVLVLGARFLVAELSNALQISPVMRDGQGLEIQFKNLGENSFHLFLR